jgi:hypothetical protein
MLDDVKNTETTETGFHYAMREDGIVVYHVEDLKIATVDHFTETVKAMDQQCYAAGRHARSVIDISQLAYVSPYAIRRVREMVLATPDDLTESVAVITPTSMIYTFVSVALRNLPVARTSGVRFFATQEDAMIWLEERLYQLGP